MFLNIDLDIISNHDLSPIIKELDDKVYVVNNTYIGGEYHLTLELSGLFFDHADACLTHFCDVLETLSDASRHLWQSAKKRVFDVSFELEHSPEISTLSEETIRRISNLGASIHISISPVVQEAEIPEAYVAH